MSGSVTRQPLNSRTLPYWRSRVPAPGYDRELVTQIANGDLFGDLADDERFMTAYRSTLASLRQRGARATVESLA